MRRSLTALVAVLMVGGLAGCTAPQEDTTHPSRSSVDVDTPTLRDMRKAAGVEPCADGGATAVDGGLPALTLPCLGGGHDVDLSSLKGPMVVNLWQAFCGPCREEMPALQAFYADHGDQVAVVGIDYQDVQPEAALQLVKKTGVTYPLVADPGGDLNGNGAFPRVRGLPYLAFVAADGSLAYVGAGGVSSEQELVDLVHEHLGIDL